MPEAIFTTSSLGEVQLSLLNLFHSSDVFSFLCLVTSLRFQWEKKFVILMKVYVLSFTCKFG